MTEAAEPQEWALQAQDLSFSYPGAAPVFQRVSLGVRKREIVCLLGGSGCGKSSLLRVLAGLQPPSTGAIQFLDAPMREPDPRSALVFQQASLLPWLTVTGNAGFGLDFQHQPKLTREAHQARVAQAIDAVGLKGREKLYPSALSGGMAQRVALARALAREPELLFADEPFPPSTPSPAPRCSRCWSTWCAAGIRPCCSSRTISMKRSWWPTASC